MRFIYLHILLTIGIVISIVNIFILPSYDILLIYIPWFIMAFVWGAYLEKLTSDDG